MVLIIELTTTGIRICHLTRYIQRYTVAGVALRGTCNISKFNATQAI